MTLDDVRLAVGLASLDGRKALVVEDDAWHYERMLRWLEHEGVSAIGLVSVSALDASVTGRTAAGDSVETPLAEIGAAFLDYYFPGPFHGGDLARAFSNAGVRCFGMSSVSEKNREMVALGAVTGMRKRELAALLG